MAAIALVGTERVPTIAHHFPVSGVRLLEERSSGKTLWASRTMSHISVNMLCYGDYPELAKRCLDSVVANAYWPVIADVRVGLNDVGPVTAQHIEDVGKQIVAAGVPFMPFLPERNVGKYPLMRRMLGYERCSFAKNDREAIATHDDAARPYDLGPIIAQGARVPAHAVIADYMMWLDDDSYLQNSTPEWWTDVLALMEYAHLLGSCYKLSGGFRPGQAAAIEKQSWYTGLSVRGDYRPSFVTGGWWVARTGILYKWNYPFPELYHNGGDSLLGELCRQQGYTTRHFRRGVAINYDATRGGESRAPRRGLATKWPWEDGGPTGLEHQEFDCEMTRVQPCKE